MGWLDLDFISWGLRKGELTFSHLLSFLELEPPGGVHSPADISVLSQKQPTGGLGNGCAILLVAVGCQDCGPRI